MVSVKRVSDQIYFIIIIIIIKNVTEDNGIIQNYRQHFRDLDFTGRLWVMQT
jgi:hypothetical protein